MFFLIEKRLYGLGHNYSGLFMQMAHAPMLRSKFIHLRHLSMVLTGALLYPMYDYLSLASFLDAAPSLETFDLNVSCHSYYCDISIVVVEHDLNLPF